MENRETPAKYLDFILQKSIDDLKRDSKVRLDFDAVNMYFNYVKKAKDTLKAIYTLMHIAKMKDTAVYLTFVLKKIKEGAVNFDTLDENAREDCEYIKGELLKNFSLSVEAGDEPELKIPEVSGSGLSEMIKENKFKVKTDEDASIAEEFSEKEFYSDEDNESEEVTEEPLQDDDSEVVKMTFGDEEFELISNSEEGDEGFEILDGEEVKNKIAEEMPQRIEEGILEEKVEDLTESVDTPEFSGEIEGEGFVIKKKIVQEPEEETPEEIKEEVQEEFNNEKTVTEDEENISDEELEESYEEGYIESEVIIEETDDTILIEEKAEVEDTDDEDPDSEKDEESSVINEETKQDEETPESGVSEQYKDYENTLFEVNELLKDYFLDIESVPDGAASPDGEPVIFGKIVELCNIMRNRSDRMSFSIISNVYRNTGGIFKEYLKTNSRPNPEELEKFNKGIFLIEGLIKGDDIPEADDILASLEALRKSFTDTVLTEETSTEDSTTEKVEDSETPSEIISEEKEEYKESAKPSVSLREKYSNAELRESFKQLKLQIQDLENTFQSLDRIEGEYQNYEGLRTLSSTFINLKEIIRRAKILDLKNVAKLSEAGYVFIKFIQNYRMNPFDEDIREIFKYIIYNFKAAALDKPNEDLERFISYLNDPVKIFTQQNKKRN